MPSIANTAVSVCCGMCRVHKAHSLPNAVSARTIVCDDKLSLVSRVDVCSAYEAQNVLKAAHIITEMNRRNSYCQRLREQSNVYLGAPSLFVAASELQ